MRETFDGRYYYPITDDLIGFLHLQGGQIDQIGGGYLPLIDNFNLGPTLVRGFAPGGIGPRDICDLDNICGQRRSAARPISAARRRSSSRSSVCRGKWA